MRFLLLISIAFFSAGCALYLDNLQPDFSDYRPERQGIAVFGADLFVDREDVLAGLDEWTLPPRPRLTFIFKSLDGKFARKLVAEPGAVKVSAIPLNAGLYALREVRFEHKSHERPVVFRVPLHYDFKVEAARAVYIGSVHIEWNSLRKSPEVRIEDRFSDMQDRLQMKFKGKPILVYKELMEERPAPADTR